MVQVNQRTTLPHRTQHTRTGTTTKPCLFEVRSTYRTCGTINQSVNVLLLFVVRTVPCYFFVSWLVLVLVLALVLSLTVLLSLFVVVIAAAPFFRPESMRRPSLPPWRWIESVRQDCGDRSNRPFVSATPNGRRHP